VSHIPQRKEKDCLNCGTIVQGRYCQECGQENVEPKETFWHMVTHFFYDITHFDSSFFHTVHHLIIRPGFLSKEYVRGKRASYLHPIRMYVFSSAIFFLLFFSFFAKNRGNVNNAEKPMDSAQRAVYIKSLEDSLQKNKNDTVLLVKLMVAKDTTKPLLPEKDKNGFHIGITNRDYKSFGEYDSIQKTLLPDQRDNWLERRVNKKAIDLDNKFRDNPEEAGRKLLDSVLHRLPYMLFISLPLFALILKLVYIRRKQFYYYEHGVFTIHLYVFSFIVLMVAFALDELSRVRGWGFIDIFEWLLFFSMFFYLYKAMRKFYGQRRGKTFIKFLLVSLFSFIMMLVLFIFIMIFSAATF
jgi:hypothetical protein